MLPGPVSIPPPLPEMARHASAVLTLDNGLSSSTLDSGTGRKIIDIWTLFYYNLTENKTQRTAITRDKCGGFKNSLEEHNKPQEAPESAQPCHLCYGKLASNCLIMLCDVVM